MTGAVLVTGANGFVGRAVCRYLQEGGWPVLAAVRPGRSAPAGCEPRLAPDLSPDADWRAALAGASYVIHSAARVHQMGESPEFAWEAHRKANLDGTLALAKQAAQASVKRFVFVSTAKVMGEHNPPGQPFADQNPPNPQDPYARSKWQAEQALLALTGLETAILRPPLVYGDGATANLESLMRLIVKGVPLPFGGVENRRSLVSANNLANALALLLNHPAAPGRSFLIKDLDVSTPGLIRQLAQALDRPARLLFVPAGLLNWGARLLGKRDLAERVLGSLEIDDSRLRQTLGWTPPFDPAQEMARMAKAFTQDL
ncbi:NAD-dependent dehydratase [Rhodospirillaceae bacterium LM-1]|nr:NAD-dependent dehydratase [Rhodospirillaceae bacterium LM-1]